jgi:hypothetical protein
MTDRQCTSTRNNQVQQQQQQQPAAPVAKSMFGFVKKMF